MPTSAAIESRAPTAPWFPSRKKAVQIAVTYLIVSFVWILCSSQVLRHLVHDPVKVAFLEDVKGFGFVLLTGILLAFLLDRYLLKIQSVFEQIQDSEARLHLVGDNLPDGYIFQYTIDQCGKARFSYISAGVERVHGVSAAEVLRDANSLLCQLAPQQVPVYLASVAASARDLTDFEMEIHWRKPGGEVRFLHVRSRPRHGTDGMVQWDGFSQDITARKQAEEALRKSEELLSETGRTAKIGGWDLDVATGKGSWTQEVARIHDLDPSIEPSLQMGLSFYEDTSKVKIESAVEAAIRDATPYDLDLEIRSAKGVHKWIRTICRPVVQDGKVVKLQGALQDITDRKQAEDALRESEANFRAMFELASIGMAQTDPRTGQWLRVNQKFCNITGYSSEELLKLKIPDITHPDDRENDWELFQKMVRGEASDHHFEKRYIRKDGVIAWVSINVAMIRNGAGEAVRTMAAIEDITQRKRAEDTLQLQSAALEAAANAIVITDRTGKIEWANRAFTALTGYALDEALGRRPSLLKSGQHNREFYQQLWQTILTGKVWHSEMINRHKDGHLYTEEAIITPVLDADGEIQHFIAVKQDVTARKQAELQLEQTHHQLLGLSRQAAVAEFATSILHNVGNVLNSVGVASSCLADSLKKSNSARLSQVVALIRSHETDLGSFFSNDPKGKLVPNYLAQLADKLASEQAAALKEIAQLQKNVEHIKGIVTVQQDSAKGSGVTETLDFTDLVEDALKLHSNALARSQIRIIREFQQVPPVIVQKHRVLQILVNLIRNAIQACDASEETPKELKLRLSRSEDMLQCAVADSGIGISSENLQRLFTFGFTTKSGGHGFGLHGAHLAAREMGGALVAQSDGPHRGATFTLRLPLFPANSSATRATSVNGHS